MFLPHKTIVISQKAKGLMLSIPIECDVMKCTRNIQHSAITIINLKIVGYQINHIKCEPTLPIEHLHFLNVRFPIESNSIFRVVSSEKLWHRDTYE